MAATSIRTTPDGPAPAWVVTAVTAAMITATLPTFLVGALSPRIGAELGMTERGIGVAVSAFFLAGALASVPGGRLTDRRGSTFALRTGLTVATTGAAGVAVLADRAWILAACMAVGGIALGLVDPGAARALSARVPRARQGLAFGVKEGSVPAATLLAGLVLPVLGDRIGWRSAFAIGAVAALVVASTALPAGLDRVARPSAEPDVPRADPAVAASRSGGLLVALSVAACIGVTAASALATFLVPALLRVGTSDEAAGTVLAIASGAAVLTRIAMGSVADRGSGRELHLVAGLLAVGSLGTAGLATQQPGLVIGAAILALGAGWGWTGLLFLAAVRIDPAQPARSASIVLAGLGIGGAAGPAALGVLVDTGGYGLAWTVAAAAMAAAAAITAIVIRVRGT